MATKDELRMIRVLREQAEYARNDFSEYARFVLGVKPADHQKQWISLAQDIGDDPRQNAKKLIIAPPGSGKSYLMGIGFMSWMIGKYHNEHYGLLSYADKVAWDRSDAIKRLMMEPAYKITFPHIKKTKKWGNSIWRVERDNAADPHPTLRAGGTRSAVVSYRLDGLLIDDPHDIKNAGAEKADQMEKVFTNYRDAILTRLTDKSWQMCITTRWAEGDFASHLMKRRGWEVIKTEAKIDLEDGKWSSYWPQQYSKAYIRERMEEDPELFFVQYQGDVAGGSAGIIRKLMTYNDSLDEVINKFKDDGGFLVASGWDTAFKKESQNDYTVGYTAGLDKFGRVWIFDRFKDRVGHTELCNEMIRNYKKWDEHAIWVEDAANGTPAVDTLMEKLPSMPTSTVRYQGGKHSKAHSLAQYCHGGHVLFPANAEWFEDAKKQLRAFPRVAHDDDIDALYIVVHELLNCVHPDLYNENREGLDVQMV